MKHLFLFLLALLPLTPHVLHAADDASILLGNSKNRSTYLMAAGGEGTSGVALCYDETTLQAFRGCQISEFRLDLYAPTGEDSLRFFVARSTDAEPLAEWVTTGMAKGWNTVSLDAPFTIPDDGPLVIGYEILGARYLQYSESFMPCSESVRVKDGEWESAPDGFKASFYAVITGDALPKHNIFLTWARLPRYGWTGNNLRFEGSFVNLGTEPVQRISADVLLDDAVLHSTTLEVGEVAARKAGSFAFEMAVPATDCGGDLRIEVSKVNDSDDASPLDNRSRTEKFLRQTEGFTPRTILAEMFSTENCTNCPNFHKIVQLFLEEKGNVVEVVHHSGFLTDKLTVPESEEMLWFYPPNKLYAPAIMFDRTNFGDNLPDIFTDGTPVAGITQEGLKRRYAEAMEIPAFAMLRLFVEPDAEARTIDVEVLGDMLLPWDDADGNLRLNVYVTEDSIVSTTQRGAAGKYYHRHALRKVLTPTWGDAITDDSISARYSLEIPDDWQFNRLSIVAFLTAYTEDDPNRSPVLATSECGLADTLLGMHPVISDSSAGVPRCFYHPGGILQHQPGAVFHDLSGRRVSGDAPQGIYISTNE